MKHRYSGSLIATLVAGLAATLPVIAATEDTFHQTLAVEPGGTLTVEIPFGAIEVVGTDRNELVLEARRRVRGRSAEAEKTFLAERPVTVTQDGNTITVRAFPPGTKASSSLWGKRNAGMKETSGKYRLRIPSKFDVQLNTAGGSVEVTELTGNVRAMTSGGGLSFVRITGPIEGKTAGGRIVVQGCQGELAVETSGGGIEVTGGGGSLKANTAGGSIAVKDFNGPARVMTSGGGLTIENVVGEVKGVTSGGSIRSTLPQPVPGPVRLETSGGSITLGVSEQAAFELDGSTSGGSCSSEIALTRQTSSPKDRNSLRGVFGDGGPSVVLRSSGGGIRIRRSDSVR